MTRPMIRSVVPSDPPAWPMCTGVMTITPTITEWDTTTEVRPRRPAGEAQTARTAAPVAWRGPGLPSPPPSRRASSNGSGRSSRSRAAATTAKATADTANPPPRAGSPRARPRSAPGPARLGPSTEPTVVAHTTRDRSRPRRAGDARSAAAYRAWSPQAVAAPKANSPTTSRTREDIQAAATVITAPITATAYPAARPARRPDRSLIRASGTASTAAPRTPAVVPRPAALSVPATSRASSPPTVIPTVTPRPARATEPLRTPTVRRWTTSGSTSGTAGTGGCMGCTGAVCPTVVHGRVVRPPPAASGPADCRTSQGH
jgi:hypothetical protein